MAIGGIDEDSWATRLAPQLTGKAQQAYAAMSREDADSYRKVKEAVLRRYNICAEPTPFPDDTKEGGRGVRGAGHTTPGPRAEVAVGVRVSGGSHREDRGGAAGQHAAVRRSNMVIRKEACEERGSGKAGRRLYVSKTASETDTQRPEGGWGWRWARQAQMSQVRWRGAF